MKFVIQKNLLNSKIIEKMLLNVKKYPHLTVDMIPYTEEFIASEKIDGVDYIPYGSTSLTLATSKLGWKGLHFDIDKMNYNHFSENRFDMLNRGCMAVEQAIKFYSIQDPESEWFMRPSKDLKQFSGQIVKAKEGMNWLISMTEAIGGGSYYMPPEEFVVVDVPKKIQAEWRWFIVGGKIVTGSMYMAHNQLRSILEESVDVIEEAQRLADIWLPDECVVMDTALVDDVVKVVEFNCINSSGFYAAEVDKIFEALYNYHTEE